MEFPRRSSWWLLIPWPPFGDLLKFPKLYFSFFTVATESVHITLLCKGPGLLILWALLPEMAMIKGYQMSGKHQPAWTTCHAAQIAPKSFFFRRDAGVLWINVTYSQSGEWRWQHRSQCPPKGGCQQWVRLWFAQRKSPAFQCLGSMNES